MFLASSSKLNESRENPGRLCKRCEAIDFDVIFQKRLTRAKGTRLLKLGTISELRNQSSCPLCWFFARLIYEERGPSAFEDDAVHHLYAFSDVRAFLVGLSPMESTVKGLRGGVCLAVLSENAAGSPQLLTQFIGQHQPLDCSGLRITRINPPADFNRILQWISFCSAHHTSHCALEPTQHIPGLQVVDCLSGKVVDWEGQKYSALSYVWGDSNTREDREIAGGPVPTRMPAVITDAMALSLRLGLQYIWIDKYCIPQDDFQEKQRQIRHMDLVYKSAEITIVAAAGSDPQYGLPGVGLRARIPQQTVKLPKRTLLASLPNPAVEIKKSKWMSRAWTYQEALLSRRRLIFTDHQVYFECRAMHCCEAITVPLEAIHTQNKQQCKNSILPGLFPHNIVGQFPDEIFQRINEYSQRELRYESDRLNAILGVLHAIAESGLEPRYHIGGVPLLFHMHSRLHALLAGLLWYHKEPTERCPSHPSWSWTGWKGRIETSPLHRGLWNRSDSQVWIESGSKLIEWPKDNYHSSEILRDAYDTRYLHIEAWTFELRFRHCADEISSGFKLVAATRDAVDGSLERIAWSYPLILSREAREGTEFFNRLQTEIFLGIVLSVAYTTSCRVLVVEAMEERVERIGVMSMEFEESIFDKTSKEVIMDCGIPVRKMVHRLG